MAWFILPYIEQTNPWKRDKDWLFVALLLYVTVPDWLRVSMGLAGGG